jgi:hypothetical protein
MEPADFDAAADYLYRRLPDEFTVARDEKVSEARSSGNPALANAIKALRRPTVSAWLANWLAHERPDDVGRLLTLGASMRAASNRLAGEELRELYPLRHEILNLLVGEARNAANDADIAFSDATVRELENTLTAALSDEYAAAGLQAGRLTASLEYTGFGSTGPSRKSSTPAGKRSKPSSSKHPAKVERGSVRQSKEAVGKETRGRGSSERILKEAENESNAARRQVDERAKIADETRTRIDKLRDSVRDLEIRLNDLRAEEIELSNKVAAAEEDQRLAEQVAEAADRKLSKTRREVGLELKDDR